MLNRGFTAAVITCKIRDLKKLYPGSYLLQEDRDSKWDRERPVHHRPHDKEFTREGMGFLTLLPDPYTEVFPMKTRVFG